MAQNDHVTYSSDEAMVTVEFTFKVPLGSRSMDEIAKLISGDCRLDCLVHPEADRMKPTKVATFGYMTDMNTIGD